MESAFPALVSQKNDIESQRDELERLKALSTPPPPPLLLVSRASTQTPAGGTQSRTGNTLDKG